MMIDIQGVKSDTFPIAKKKAFIAWVVGSNRATFYTASVNMVKGSIRPPNKIEGNKMSWDQSTVERVLEDITPINTPIPANAKVVTIKVST